MTTWNAAQIADVAYRAGFRGRDLEVAVAVALAESGGQTGVNAKGAEDSRGLWQINSAHFGSLDESRLGEPLYNAKAAHKVWEESKGFRSDPWDAWSTYQQGSHNQFLDDARRAIAKRDSTHASGPKGGQGAALRPWHLPKHPFGGGMRTVLVDGEQLDGLAHRLTGLLATVETAYLRCRRERADLGALDLPDEAAEKKLKHALDELLDDWDGLRRLPYLMSRDIGFIVESWRRFSGADRGEARATVEHLVRSLHGGRADGSSKAGKARTAALLRALYGPDRGAGVRTHLPTTPHRHSHSHSQPDAPQRITLRKLADIGHERFGLAIREYAPYDKVDPVHANGSFHYRNRAFDASGSTKDMSRFADWVSGHYGKQLKELFWNGPGARNVDEGRRVGKGFVPGHTDHVHVAM